MSYITTHKKVHFDPLHPCPDELLVEDIAHALSLLCRANGHYPHFFSVAQHCLCCAAEAQALGYSSKVQLACLLHDAGEAYLSDMTRPVKAQLPNFSQIEDKLLQMIWDKWLPEPLSEQEYTQVFAIDDAMLEREFCDLMGESVLDGVLPLRSNPDFGERPFADVEQCFVDEFHRLTARDQVANTDDLGAKGETGERLANIRVEPAWDLSLPSNA